MRIATLKLITKKRFRFKDVEKFRGFMGNFFQNEILFHNHLNDYNVMYKSAQIQYKLISGCLLVVGIGEGATLLEENKDYIKLLNIDGEMIKVENQEFEINDFIPQVVDNLITYEFVSEWYALNSENYLKYQQEEFSLDKQLQNNILEFFKMCGIWVDKAIMAKTFIEKSQSTVKGIKIITFTGEFVTNVELPNWIGLGKRKSIGYGTIKKK